MFSLASPPEKDTVGDNVSAFSSDTPALASPGPKLVSSIRSSRSATSMPAPDSTNGTSIRSPPASARPRLTRNVTESAVPPSVNAVAAEVFANVTTVGSLSLISKTIFLAAPTA